jgi:excisionase family DNA binding protein
MKQYTYPEAAAYLGITERQLRRARYSGRIGYSKLGQRVTFSQDQLDAFRSANTHEPIS